MYSNKNNLISVFVIILIVTSGIIDAREISNKFDVDRNGDNQFSGPTQDKTIAINCSILTPELIHEIQSYQPVANLIIQTALNGAFKGMVYNATADLADKFGHRLPGSLALEDSIDYLLDKMRTVGLTNIRGEEVSVPVWVRGSESAEMLVPRHKTLSMLGLILSVGTPLSGITAEAIVVRRFEELQENAEQVLGKIVVYNQAFTSYNQAFTSYGATEAAKLGAVGALVRSVTPFSLDTPHTGHQVYAQNVTQIPVACITVEDAQMLSRIYHRGERIILRLNMEAQNYYRAGISRNAIGELLGRQNPNEIVIVSGHIDSWDVGQGIVDDGAASVFSAETLSLLKYLNLTPRRTISAVLWTAEETGLQGAASYVERHRQNLDKIIAAFESDTGTFSPLGIDYAGPDDAGCIVQEIVKLIGPTNATTFRKFPIVISDISLLTAEGVPSLSLNSDRFDNHEYFMFHHSQAYGYHGGSRYG